MEYDVLYNTFNRFCKYLETNNCPRVFIIERDDIVFKLNNKLFPNNIIHSYSWFCSIKPLDIQTQLNYFLLPLDDKFPSIFMDVQNFPHRLPSDMVHLISLFGVPKSLEEINIKLDLFEA